MASADDTLVMANKQRKTVMAALSCSSAVDTEIIDLTTFLKITEETGIVTSCIIGKALDGMSIADENTAEGRNRGEGGCAEIQIIIQNEDFSL